MLLLVIPCAWAVVAAVVVYACRGAAAGDAELTSSPEPTVTAAHASARFQRAPARPQHDPPIRPVRRVHIRDTRGRGAGCAAAR
jgi:hypothetical protein